MFGPGIWRLGRVSDPFSEMQRLQREMNRLFSHAGGRLGHDYPAINVLVGQNDAVLTCELPGIDPEKMDISVTGDVITLSGSREPEKIKEGETYHRQERVHGRFTRTLQLPFSIDAGKVDAKYERGILNITLPRAEEDKPKKISIKSE